MRLFAALFAVLGLIVATPSMAQSQRRQDSVEYPQGRSDWRASNLSAKENFWRYVDCIAEKDPEDADRIVYSDKVGRDFWKEVRRLTRDNERCLDGGTLELGFKPILLQGMLGGIRVAQRYEDRPLPDYTSVPLINVHEAFPADASPMAQKFFLMQAFAECVVRADTQTVFDLLLSEYRKPAAMPYWRKLNEPMSYCLPAEEGDAIELDPFDLRLHFGGALVRLETKLMARANLETEAAE